MTIAAVATPSFAAARLALISAVFIALYQASNAFSSTRSDVGDGVFAWERAIPFVPWTIVPYLSIIGFFVQSFFLGRDARALDRHIARLLLALAISLVCYATFPLRFTFERPATSGLLGLLFQALSAFDLPYNRAPSLHISVLVILWARFAPCAAGWQAVVLHGWFTLIGVSVLTTYQHHVIDIPAGLAVGAVCIWVTRKPSVAATDETGDRQPRTDRPSAVTSTERLQGLRA